MPNFIMQWFEFSSDTNVYVNIAELIRGEALFWFGAAGILNTIAFCKRDKKRVKESEIEDAKNKSSPDKHPNKLKTNQFSKYGILFKIKHWN
jgi:hypothetical protein